MNPDRFSRAPYPGLRSFRREETDLFFGREDCVGAMVDRLRDTRFLAVLGSSGTGKSSVVKTGLLDALEVGLMASAGSNWRIVDFKPGGAPLANLARHLLETDEPAGSVGDADVALLRGFLARGPRAIIEWCRDGHLPKGTNLLLLVDQFEELFRYQNYEGQQEAEALVALLLESAHSPEFPIYVTITMRSEFLGACTLIQGLAEAISAGMVLTPRMTREQCRAAIERPAGVCRIEVEQPLVGRLLNDLANFAPFEQGDNQDQLEKLARRADQLPLLQYTLNRMWLEARERWVKGGWMDSGPLRLRLSEYERIGGLTGALNNHADQILKDLTEQGLEGTVHAVFRALIAGTAVENAVRRPTRFGELVALAGGNRDAVRKVVDTFREPGCNFLTPELDPNDRKPLPDDAYVDISHESLIRQWKKLSEWLATESRASQNWRRLKDNVDAGYRIGGKELADLVAWRNEFKPNEPWAKRYGGSFPAAMAFLDDSERSEAAERRRTALVRQSIIGLVVIVLVSFGSAMYYEEAQRTKIAQAERDAALTAELASRKAEERAQQMVEAADKANAQNAKLVEANAQLKSDNARLQSENDELKAQIEALRSQTKVVDNPKPPPVIKLGPAPFRDDYAGEADYAGAVCKDDPKGEKPPETLQKDVNTAPPCKIPGGTVLITKLVYSAVSTGKLNNAAFLIVDVSDDQQHPTIPTAQRLAYAGAGGAFSDDVQQKLFEDMKKLNKNNWGTPVIFFGRDAKSWAAYNASLRAIEMGMTHVYWYRGGLASWQEASQPVGQAQPADKPADPPKGSP